MKTRRSKLKKILALTLSVAMLGSSMDMSALRVSAEETGSVSDTVQSEEQENNESSGSGENVVEDAVVEFTVSTPENDLPDNDELFAGYVEQAMYGDYGIALFGNFGEDRLSDTNETIYKALKEQIEQVAAGTLSSAQFNLGTVDGLSWTASELGCSSGITAENVETAAGTKFAEVVDTNAIMNYLLMDCPYDLYWFDKTVGMQCRYAMAYSSDYVTIKNLTFSFTVASEYKASGAADEYTVDTAKAQAVQTAVTNAKEIVAAQKGKSDYEKLIAYRQAICELVSYNDEAAGDSAPAYGNPWQLIWVFDKDETTEVVCEGYAKAFQYLCDLSEFSNATCYTVDGTMRGGTGEGAHMWNIVTLDGKNYLVDVTNCDTGSIGADDKLFLVGTSGSVESGYTFAVGSGITYTYAADQIALYEGTDILTLADSAYVPAAASVAISSAYKTTKTYDGKAFDVPTAEEMEITGASYANVVFSWYENSDDTDEMAAAPVAAGTYYLKATIPATAYTGAVSVNQKVTIEKRPVTITAKNQSISLEQASEENLGFDWELESSAALAEGDTFITTKVSVASAIDTTKAGRYEKALIPEVLINNSKCENVTDSYEITYVNGTLVVEQESIEGADVVLDIPEEGYTYDGTEKKPGVTVSLNGTKLTEDTDYTVAYSDNVNAGEDTAVVTVKGKGNYAGSIEKSFSIQKKTIKVDVTVADKVFDGTYEVDQMTEQFEGVAEKDAENLILDLEACFLDNEAGENVPVSVSVSFNEAVSDAVRNNYEIPDSVETTANINPRPVTVRANAASKTYGEADPELTYTVDETTPLAEGYGLVGELTRENDENAGTYQILQGTLTNDNNSNYDITYNSADFTINKATYTVDVLSKQTVVQGIADFIEPSFVDKNDQKVDGTLTYTYGSETGLTYEALVSLLKNEEADAVCTVSFTFAPDDANYVGAAADTNTGSIQLTVKDVEFTVGGSAATVSNAVTIKDSPVYGDTWAEIVTLNQITASVGNETDNAAAHFTLDVSGTPNAGVQTFCVYYNGTISGKTFANVMVCTGTVDVAKKTVTVTAGDYKVSKVYDGTTAAGEVSGNLQVNGILAADTDVTVEAVPDDYTNADAGAQTSVTVSLILNGSAKNNYQLKEESISVPCEITKRPVTVQADDIRNVYGELNDELTYYIIDGSVAEGETLTGELVRELGDNAGTYQILQGTLTEENNSNYSITFQSGTYTIEPTEYYTCQAADQVILKDVCEFAEPVFVGVNDETIAGTLTYEFEGQEGLSYQQVVELLKECPTEETMTIYCHLVPTSGGNYTGEKNESFDVTVRAITFFVDGVEADLDNTVTVKASPVYGDTWADILQLNTGLTASFEAEKDADQSHFSLDVSGTPDAGEQIFHVYYNGTLAGVNCTNVLVCSGTVTIGKADYTGRKSGEVSVIYGNQGSFDLSAMLPEGAKLGQPAAEDSDDVLSSAAALEGTILTWKVVEDEQAIGKTAVITVPVTETTNYQPYDITVTVTVTEKMSQDDFGFKDAAVDKIYGDSDFTVAAIGAAEGSSITYTSSDSSVATVDNAGKVKILKAGTAVITATAAETSTHLSATTAYTLNIAKKELTWDVTELYAVDREGSVTDKKATLYGTLKVSGITETDEKTVTFTCPAEKLAGTYVADTRGTQIVTLTWADAENPVVLQGEGAENYLLPASLPKITGTINEVREDLQAPAESTDGVQYKLSVETGISRVPDTLKDNEKLNTPAKIMTEMKLNIQKASSDIAEENIVVYDVDLLVNINGQGWVKATEANFPKDGLTITLPYPSGTGKDTHDFTVAHLFVADMNGYKAGDIEYPEITETDAGIQFKVHGLSPISVGWKTAINAEVKPGDTTQNNAQTNTGSQNTSTNTTANAGTSTTTDQQASSQVTSAVTSDNSSVAGAILLYALAVVCIALGVKRRRTAGK